MDDQSSNHNEEIENLRKKLRYRSWHRGTREMDMIMGRFADAHLENFNQEQLENYEAILTENDPNLYNWLSGRETLPEELSSPVMHLFIDFAGRKND